MLLILSGVAGSGKDTIKKELIKRMENVESLPSFTDRAPRIGEVEGQIYHFVETEEFERMIEAGELYEYDVHHERYYGTSKKLMNEKRVESVVPVRKDRMRLLSPMRCIMSPTFFESKNRRGSFISFVKKSDMREILIRLFM